MTVRIARTILCLSAFTVVLAAPRAFAFDAPVFGKKVIASSEPAIATARRRFVLRGEGPAGFISNPASGTTSLVASEVSCVATPPGEFCLATATSGSIELDPTLWKALGNPPGSKGYRYRDRSGSRGGIRSVVLRPTGQLLIRAVGPDWPLVPIGGQSGLQVRLTRDTLDYCADFGGTKRRNDAGRLRFRNAAAPANCPAACGNGFVETGEGCDPPDGTTCDAACRLVCGAILPGTTLIACSSGESPTVSAAGDGVVFVAAYTDAANEGQRLRAVRFDALGIALDDPPLEVSGGSISASEPLAVADDVSFYLGWGAADPGFARTRRVPFSGSPFGPIEIRVTRPPFTGGMCGTSIGGPLGLGAEVDSGQPYLSYAETAFCPNPLATWLVGVPGAGANLTGPPVFIDAPPAVFARSGARAAAAWVRGVLDTNVGPNPQFSIMYNWMAPAPLPTAGTLSSLPTTVDQLGLAATGNIFLVVWATASEVRGARFTAPGTSLDPDGGFLIAAATASADLVAATSDTTQFIVAWRESTAGPNELRAVHVATDGSVIDAAPLLIASADTIGDIGLAAGSSATVAVISTLEPSGAHAIRVAPIP